MDEKIFCDKKNFVRPTYAVKAGSYSLVNGDRPTGWVYCRDSFQGQSTNMKEMLFCHKAGISENIALFIFKIETILRHTKLTYCGPTNINRFMWIRPAAFWTRQPIRRSLFTALLRAAQKYDPAKENFEAALYSNQYLRASKPAVQRFLAGYTWYKGHATGWDNAFRGLESEEVTKLLTLKPIKDQELLKFATELLGTSVEDLKIKYRKDKYGKNSSQPVAS
jgi:hypothetical protein